MPDYVDWLIWQPVTLKMGSLLEVETTWSIEDVWKAHVVSEAQREAEERAYDKGKRK